MAPASARTSWSNASAPANQPRRSQRIMAARKRTSRKSSAASSRSQRDAERLASLVFFIDRSLGKRVVAQSLRDAGAHVEVHDDYFPQDPPTLIGLRRS